MLIFLSKKQERYIYDLLTKELIDIIDRIESIDEYLEKHPDPDPDAAAEFQIARAEAKADEDLTEQILDKLNRFRFI